MKRFFILLVLPLPFGAQAGECETLAAISLEQERQLQTNYMPFHVPRNEWVDFLRASDWILKDRYDQRVAICKEELKK